MKHFDYGEEDFIPCEACGKPGVDVHHINGRGRGMDTIENLMALCRKCHELAHSEKLSKSEMLYIHRSFMLGKRITFIK